MLMIRARALSHNGIGLSRRGFLTVGGLGLAGLTLPDMLRAREAERQAGRSPRNTSVVWLFLSGGPSHIDSYDMKPDAPREFRGPYQAAPTNVPGIRLCELMPRQAPDGQDGDCADPQPR